MSEPSGPIDSWYVLCHRERLIPLTDVAPRLGQVPDVRVAVADADYLELVVNDSLTGNTGTVRIFVDDHADVIVESREYAASLEEQPGRDRIAAADARYAITWDRDRGDETYNLCCVAAEVLGRASGGIVFDLGENRIVFDPAEEAS